VWGVDSENGAVGGDGEEYKQVAGEEVRLRSVNRRMVSVCCDIVWPLLLFLQAN